MTRQAVCYYTVLWALKEDNQPLYQLLWEVRSALHSVTDKEALELTKATVQGLLRAGYVQVDVTTPDGARAVTHDSPELDILVESPDTWVPAVDGDLNRVQLTSSGDVALESGEWAKEFDADALIEGFKAARSDSERWAYASALVGVAYVRLADELVALAFDENSGTAGGILLLAAALAGGSALRPRIESALGDARLAALARKALAVLDTQA